MTSDSILNDGRATAYNDYLPLPDRADSSTDFRDGYREGIVAAATYLDTEEGTSWGDNVRADFRGVLGEQS